MLGPNPKKRDATNQRRNAAVIRLGSRAKWICERDLQQRQDEQVSVCPEKQLPVELDSETEFIDVYDVHLLLTGGKTENKIKFREVLTLLYKIRAGACVPFGRAPLTLSAVIFISTQTRAHTHSYC